MDFKLPLSRSIYSAEYVPFCETLWLHHVSGRVETLCYVEERHVAELRGSSSPDQFLHTLVRPLNAAHYYPVAVPN